MSTVPNPKGLLPCFQFYINALRLFEGNAFFKKKIFSKSIILGPDLGDWLERHCDSSQGQTTVSALPQLYRVALVSESLFVPQFPHPLNENINVFPSLPHGEYQ